MHDQKTVVSVKRAAELLGVVSDVVYDAVERGLLKARSHYIAPGNSVRPLIRLDDLEDYRTMLVGRYRTYAAAHYQRLAEKLARRNLLAEEVSGSEPTSRRQRGRPRRAAATASD